MISIVTITRNNLAGLKITLASIVGQQIKNFEWIVVDGNSIDGSIEFLSNLRLPFAYQFQSEPDGGIFDAMNKGLARVNRDYVIFLNSGDSLESTDTLKLVSSELINSGADILYGNSRQMREGIVSSVKRARNAQAISYGMFACHQSIYYKSSLAKTIRFDTSFKCSGDYAYTAKFLKIAKVIHQVDQALCIFDMTGISEKSQIIGRRENWIVQRDILKKNLRHRVMIRIAYWVVSTVRQVAPKLYTLIRFQNKS